MMGPLPQAESSADAATEVANVAAGAAPSPERTLGGWDATSVVIGAIVGVGIFFTPSKIAALAGSGLLAMLAWVIAGGIALCGALTFAALGARYNRAGAQYEILRDAYGPLPAFVFVVCNATAIQAGAIGIIAVICARNLAAAVNGSVPAGPVLIGLAVGLIIVIGVMNVIGVKWGARIQNFTVAAKVAALVAVAAVAAAFGGAHSAMAAGVGVAPLGERGAADVLGALGAALVPAMFSFGGWQHALWISGEVKNPSRTLPRAILGGVAIVVAVYLMANWAYLELLGVDGVAQSKALASDAVASVWPGFGARATAGAVAISAFGVLNAQLLSGPRLIYGMARDGRFFEVFARIPKGAGTPVAAIVLLTVLALVLLLAAGADGVDKLLTGAVFIDSVFFALTGLALVLLRRREGSAIGGGVFRTPAFPIEPLLFFVGELGALAGAFVSKDVRSAAWIGVAWIAGAAGLYVLRFRRGREVIAGRQGAA